MELSIRRVTKKYPDKLAVDDVSLCITPGIWGLLGANGAGKTTLMRMIADIIPPTSGEICFDGVPIAALGGGYREIFGYLPQEFGFYPEFSVRDYLEYVAALKGLSRQETGRRIDGLLSELSLADVRNKKIRKLSGGMKRRVGIAQALLNDPEILILDEPTAGLDPGERIRLRKLLSDFAKERIVIISTHIVPDVEYIAANQAIMKDGKIILTGATEELVSGMEGRVWECGVSPEELPRYEEALRIVNIKNEDRSLAQLRYLSEESVVPRSVAVPPRLEDLYLWHFDGEREGEA